MVPLTITPRTINNSISGTVNTSSAVGQPVASVAQIVRGNVNVNVVTSVPSSQSSNINLSGAGSTNSIHNITTTTLPVAKVLPQQQHHQQHHHQHQQHHQQHQHQHQPHTVSIDGPTPTIVSIPSTVSGGQSVFIHSRSPSSVSVAPIMANNSAANLHLPANSQNAVSFISSASGAYYIPTTAHSGNNSNNSTVAVSTVLQSITTTSNSITTNATASTINSTSQIISNVPVTSLGYAPQAGSFAVVPASNRNSNQIHALPTTSNVQTNQSNPVRFNPQLLVDGSNNQQIQSGTIITMQQTQAHPTQHQTYQPQQITHQQGHILATVSGSKTVVNQAPRVTKIITTNAARNKRDHSETFTVAPTVAATIKSAVKNLNPTLLSMNTEPPPRPSTPGSSDGSTTVSATSSPGLDQQEQEELNAMVALHQQNRSIHDDLQYHNVDGHITIQSQKNHQHVQPVVSIVATSTASQRHPTYQSQVIFPNRNSNGSKEELTPRKRPRKQQFADSSPCPKKYGSATTAAVAPPVPSTSNARPTVPSGPSSASVQSSSSSSTVTTAENGAQQKISSSSAKKSNKDSPKVVEYYYKKPRITLLDVSKIIC